MIRSAVTIAVAIALVGLTPSCNTVAGMGKDIKKVTTPDSQTAPPPGPPAYDPYDEQD